MKAKKIITVPNPLLRQKSAPIRSFGKKTRRLAQVLIETMNQTKKENQGVGLAAIQIGVQKQMLVLTGQLGGKAEIIINPQIIWQDKKLASGSRGLPVGRQGRKTDYEGCLSVPGLWGIVKRSVKVKVKYQDLKGNWQEKNFQDFLGRVIQHEIDHLKGILFVDRVMEQKSQLFQVQSKSVSGKSGKDQENELIEVTIK